ALDSGLPFVSVSLPSLPLSYDLSFLYRSAAHRALHSFPTRRSSDLGTRGGSGIRQLIDIQPPSERAFLVGAPRKGSADAVQVEDHLDELYRLADTAGAEVVGRTYQRVEAPSPNFYLGQGKVEELKGVLQQARST